MTQNPDEYNGWTNRETWATALHIDNDEGMYRHRCELVTLAREVDASEVWTKEEAIRFTLEDMLKDWIEELAESFYFEPADNPQLGGMFNDIGSLWRVNWREIAENFLSE